MLKFQSGLRESRLIVSSLVKVSNKNELKSRRSFLFSFPAKLLNFFFFATTTFLRGTIFLLSFSSITCFIFIYSFHFIQQSSIAGFLRMLWYSERFITENVFSFCCWIFLSFLWTRRISWNFDDEFCLLVKWTMKCKSALQGQQQQRQLISEQSSAMSSGQIPLSIWPLH